VSALLAAPQAASQPPAVTGSGPSISSGRLTRLDMWCCLV
jgi:hypothetical protein